MIRTYFTVHTQFGEREFDKPLWQYSLHQNGVHEVPRDGHTVVLFGLAGWLSVEERSEQPALRAVPRART